MLAIGGVYIKKLLIIGTSSRGRSKEIVYIKNETELINEFGEEGSIIDGYRNAKEVKGFSLCDIYCIKPNGKHGSTYMNSLSEDGVVHHKSIEFIMNESIDKTININLFDDKLSIIFDKRIDYYFDKYRTTNELFKKINDDASKKISPVRVVDYTNDNISHPSKNLSSVNLSSHKLIGISGINDNKNKLYHEIEDTLEIILGEDIDIVLPINCYVDNDVIPLSKEGSTENFVMYEVFTEDFEQVYSVDDLSGIISDDKKVYISEQVVKDDIDDLFKEYYPDGREKIINFYTLFLKFCKKQSINGIITKTIIGFKPFMKTKEYYMTYAKYINSQISEEDKDFRALISECIGDLYYDCGAVIENSYIAYAVACASTHYTVNVENVSCGDKIAIRTRIDKDTSSYLKGYGFVLNRFSVLTGQVHFCSTLNKASGILTYDYVVFSLAHLYRNLHKKLGERIGELLTQENKDSFDSMVASILEEFESTSLASASEYRLNTDLNGDTYIICSLYFPNSIKPYDITIELS